MARWRGVILSVPDEIFGAQDGEFAKGAEFSMAQWWRTSRAIVLRHFT